MNEMNEMNEKIKFASDSALQFALLLHDNA